MGYLDYSAFFLMQHEVVSRHRDPSQIVGAQPYRGYSQEYATSVGQHYTSPVWPYFDVTGTWKGGMIGGVSPFTSQTDRCGTGGYTGSFGCTFEQASKFASKPVTGDVSITIELAADPNRRFPSKGTISFSNISGSVTNDKYDGWEWEFSFTSGEFSGLRHDGERVYVTSHGMIYNNEAAGSWMQAAPYGPNAEEIGGVFRRALTEDSRGDVMTGAFGAKRQ